MKTVATLAIILLLSQALMADETPKSTSEEVTEESSSPAEPVMLSMIDEDTGMSQKEENLFQPAVFDLTNVEFYESVDKPNYKPRDTIFVGGVLPLIPIRSNIDASAEDTSLSQGSVSVFFFFKQKF